MGGGTRYGSGTRKRTPFNLGVALTQGEGTDASPGDEPAFCESRQTVGFAAQPGVRVRVGQAVTAQLADPPLLVASGSVLGDIDPTGATAIRGCIELGYRMTGRIEAFDSVSQSGTASLSGRRADAP